MSNWDRHFDLKMTRKFKYKGKDEDWDTKVYSPITNRLLKRDARTTKEIISGKKTGKPYYINESGEMPILVEGTRIVGGKIRNPLTGTQISIDGPVYKKLIKAGWVQIPGRGLAPKDHVKLLNLSVLPNIRTVHHLRELLKTFTGVYPPYYLLHNTTGYKIEIQTKKKKTKFGSGSGNGGPIEINNVIGAYLDQFSNNSDIHLISDTIERLDTTNFLNEYSIAAATAPGESDSLFAMSQDGYCVKNCLKVQFPNENWDDIPECCNNEDLQRIAVSRCLRIELYACFDLDNPIQKFGTKKTSNGGGKLVKWATQLNHVVILPNNCRFASNTAPIEWFDNEKLLIDKFYEISMNQPVRPTFSSSNMISFFGFVTPDKQYKLKFEGYEKCPTAWSPVGVSLHIFHDKVPQDVRQKKLDELKRSIVRPGIHYNMPSEKTIGWLYDQKRAYSSYLKCPNYRGFPDPRSPAYILKSNKIEQMILDKYEGFVRVKTNLSYPHETCLELQHMWVGFPQLLLALEDEDNDIEIFEYLIMKRYDSDPFDHVKESFKDDKFIMNKLFGALNKTERAKYDAALSPDILSLWQDLNGSKYEQIKLDVNGDERMIYKCIHSEIDSIIPDNAYIAAYIHMYQKMSMHMDLLSHLKQFPEIEIMRIWVDGVVLSEKLPDWFVLSHMSNSDRWKPVERTTPVLGWKKEFEHDVDVVILDADISDNIFNHSYIESRVAIIGPPGSGKTYLINNYWKKGRDILLTGSTHIAANNLGGETVQSILKKCSVSTGAKRDYCANYERIVVDEFTLLSTDDLTKILQIGLPVLFVGDFKQLKSIIKPPNEQWLIDNGFHIDRLTKIHRTSDPATLKLYECIRDCTAYQAMVIAADSGVKVINTTQAMSLFPEPYQTAHIVTAKNELVDTYNLAYTVHINKIAHILIPNTDTKYYDWATTDHGQFKSPVTIGMLVIGTNTVKDGINVLFMNQEIGRIEDIYYTKDGELKNVSVRRINNIRSSEIVIVSLSKLRPGYAFTFHKLQGQTIKHPLIIDPINCFDQSMIYVAITRITDLNLLSIVTPNDVTNYKEEWLEQIHDRVEKYKNKSE